MPPLSAAATARQLAAALGGVGFGPGSRVGIYAGNCVEWMLTIRACDVLSGTIGESQCCGALLLMVA